MRRRPDRPYLGSPRSYLRSPRLFLRAPDQPPRAVYTLQDGGFPDKRRAGFFSSPGEGRLGKPGPRLFVCLALSPYTSLSSPSTLCSLSTDDSPSVKGTFQLLASPGLRVVLCPSQYCRSAYLFHPGSLLTHRVWLQCHCLPKTFHYPLVTTGHPFLRSHWHDAYTCSTTPMLPNREIT